MRVLVMGDIHGARRALDQCLRRSGFDLEKDCLIQLGDVCDGNPEVFDCVETLLQIKNLIAIKGNHDDWFLEFIRTSYQPAGWMYGGDATARSYLHLSGRESNVRKSGAGFKAALENTDIPLAHRQFFSQQRSCYIDGYNNCFVHAGFNPRLDFHKQNEENYYWDRDLWTSALSFQTQKKRGKPEKTFFIFTDFHEIFIGHTPTLNWDTDQPMRAANILNIDTGAGHGGRLTIMDVLTKEYWQSDPVMELYANPVG